MSASQGMASKAIWSGVSWRIAAPTAILGIAALLWLYFDTARSMYDLWSRLHSFDHAFLIVPVCLFLIWERRQNLTSVSPEPSLAGLIIVAGFGAVWLVADTIDVLIGRQFALIGMIQGLVFALFGWRTVKLLLFPLLYLWLVLPTDLNLLPVLQKIATFVVSAGIRLMDIPIFVEGFFIDIPSGRYWVAPGCAGLNFLLSGFALSLLYVEQIYSSWRKRIIGVLVMLIVAVIANWIRIFGLIIAGHTLGEVYDINDHYMEGWLFFAAVVFFMMWIGLRFRDPEPERAKLPPAPARMDKPRRHRTGAFVTIALACAGVIGFYPAYAAYRVGTAPQSVHERIAVPATVAAWRAGAEKSEWQPSFSGAGWQSTQRYHDGKRQLDLFIAYYAHQGQGREVAAYANRVYDGKRWRRIDSGTTMASLNGQSVEMTSMLLDSGFGRRIVWQVYWVDGRYTRRPTVAKLLQAKADLLFGDRRAGFLAVSVPDNLGEAALNDFLSALPPFSALIATGD